MFIYRLRGRRISKNGLSETHERERKMQMQDANGTRGTTSGPNLDLTTQPTDQPHLQLNVAREREKARSQHKRNWATE